MSLFCLLQSDKLFLASSSETCTYLSLYGRNWISKDINAAFVFVALLLQLGPPGVCAEESHRQVAARRLITRTKHERGLSWLQCCVIICTGWRFCSAAVQACRDCSSVGYRAPGYLADCCVPCSLRTPKFPAANISNSSAAVAREYGCRKL